MCTVSYTHLVHGHSQRHSLLQKDNQMEVSTYQKYVQEEIQYFFEHFSFDMLDEFIHDLPVSYTHLDVYKRQTSNYSRG